MSTASQSAAARYIRRGLAVIPVPTSSKNPGRIGWEKERHALEDVSVQFANGCNIGIVTGEPSGGVVDVDLDVPQAAEIAGRFLPPTLTSGRSGAVDSHWWFRSPGIRTAAFKDSDDMLVELRADGRQTLVAPSTHPEGGCYEWSRSGLEMEEIAPDALSRCVRELATATLIARNVPPQGGRHNFALALAGFLLRAGRMEPETAGRILKAAWHAAGADSADTVRDLDGIVKDTGEKAGRGEHVTGGPTVEDTAPGIVKLLCRWWGWERDAPRRSPAQASKPQERPCPVMDRAAYRGVLGELVGLVSPHTEADPVAILLGAITAFGSAYGRRGYVDVSGSRHHGNLFVGIVGDTARARKGTSWAPIENVFSAADLDWTKDRITSGLSSGEGLINAVRDKIEAPEGEGDTKVSDPGIKDKRLLVVEGELSQGLKVLRREGNTLSPVLRNAWDGRDLSTMVRHSPLKATEPHISVLGHITSTELLKHVVESETANGFANRFLWAVVRRSKKLPFGGELDKVDMAPVVRKIRDALSKEAGRMTFAESARDTWIEMYDALTEDRPGMFGQVTARAEAQTLRLAILYALADGSNELRAEHLASAYAVWGYCEDSALYLFGDQLGDADADKLLEALRDSEEGMSRTQIRDLFGRNKKPEDLQRILDLLRDTGKAYVTKEKAAGVGGGGRPAEVWRAHE